MKKIGILGGTFDAPHLGHLHISKIGIKKFNLKKLIWLITKKNPLKKKPFLDINLRIKLSKKITKKVKKIHIQYLDKKIKSSSTFKLLQYLKKKTPGAQLYFLMGTDSLQKFHKWKNWKKIPKIAKLVVFSRQNYSIKSPKLIALKKLNKKDWVYVNSKKVNISSSLIRKFW